MVIDGADQGQTFWLPEAGTVVIGNSHKHCDVCLHDLYVGRTHCHLEIEGDQVLVRALDTPTGTLVNGAKVSSHELKLGDVIRAGNSHLRLEMADGADPSPAGAATARAAEEPRKRGPLPLDELGELSGDTLGHYQLGPVLGRGHCGVVFRAHDVKKDEAVALKVLSADFPADEGEMQRFVRCVKPLLPLRHPNLVGLHGAGKSGPYVWIAQELVEGDSLTAVLGELRGARKIKWRRAWRVAVGLARALEFLRQHHLVHGNITPANILIQASDGQARLNDLFLLKALEGSQLQQATLENKLLAELPYLSPEHIDPNATADDLSDLYSLGVVVYALLTGRPPFEGDAPDETLERIRTALPENPKRFQRSIPAEFQAVVLKMLAKHPEDRYPTPTALLADLQQIAAGQEEPS
jgi:serine/threonine protein kinase